MSFEARIVDYEQAIFCEQHESAMADLFELQFISSSMAMSQ